MLALTESAVQAVKHIVWSSGLRVIAVQTGMDTSFRLDVVPLPGEDDEVIEEQGVRVFLEPEAASLLDDKVLDASVKQDRIAFEFADQLEELQAKRRERRRRGTSPVGIPTTDAVSASGLTRGTK